MLDPAMAAFNAEMRAQPRPRSASTRRVAIDNMTSAGASELARRIRSFWRDVGFDIAVEIVHAGAPPNHRFTAFATI
jgi:hypothetical protein